jgi:hypothetical protein
MNKVRIEFELEGLHALMLRAVLACVNRAPGPPHDESTLARSLICSILEEDARDNVNESVN